MRDWSLQAGDPLALTLAADSRLSTPDYLNDHIWELELRGGEPQSLTIRTTYGLRARAMRLFFRFAEGGKVVIDPADFHRAPRVRRFYPNFLLLDFVPVEGLEVTAEFWIPESHVLAGRLTGTNHTDSRRQIVFELCGVLTPLDGKTLSHVKHQMINVLAGRTSDLHPVVFMGGGPTHGADPRPSLALVLDFEARTTRLVTWACAAEGTSQHAFDLARRAAGRPWHAERARIEVLASRELLDIYTGEPDWDAAFALSQTAAASLLYPGSSHLPHVSFVRSRQPDGGYSRAGDGSDYPPSWNGQTPLETYYLASQLPLAAQLARGLLNNFISVQKDDGSIDGKPGLAGQRSKFLATPMLASLAWRSYQDTQDPALLEGTFTKLLAFCQCWFSPAHDRDGDGIPEWEHIQQTAFEDNPLFDVWYPWSQSLSISSFSSPELEALLASEAASLIQIAESQGRAEQAAALRPLVDRLASSIEAAWNPKTSLYSYRDLATGASCAGKPLASRSGPGELAPRKAEFEKPMRLLIQVEKKTQAAGSPEMEISGWGGSRSKDNKLAESITAKQFRWHTGGLVAVSRNAYRKVDRISIEGLQETDRVVVRTVDTTGEDITLFTPLWAHVASAEHAQAMLNRLSRQGDGFNRPFGIPALPASPALPGADAKEAAEADALAMGVHLPWNQLIAEGLLTYGFRDEAARLTTRLMNAVVKTLKVSQAFYERYHAETGSGLGERGALNGFAPLGLFLRTLGVQILGPSRVRLEARNPFPWPVTILYRGLRVVRGLEGTEVTFSNGQVATVTDPAACLVSL